MATTGVERVTFTEIGLNADFPQGLGKEVQVGDIQIAVFKTTDDQLFALENRTPHAKGGPLVEAIISGHYIYCPLRDLKIGLEDGLVQAPDTGQVRTFAIKIEQDRVWIGLPAA